MSETRECVWPEPVASRAGPVVYAAAEPSEHARVRSEPGRPCTTYIRDEVYRRLSHARGIMRPRDAVWFQAALFMRRPSRVTAAPSSMRAARTCRHACRTCRTCASRNKLYKQRRDREIPKTLCVRYFTRLYVVSTRGVHARPLKRAARGSTGTALKQRKVVYRIGYYSIYFTPVISIN